MRVLVTGAGGFIGGHLCKRLLEDGHAVIGVDQKPPSEWHQVHVSHLIQADLRERELCDEVMSRIEFVYDLAADMGGMGFIETHKADCMLSVLIGTHLLLAARDAGVRRFFFASSACVYNSRLQLETEARGLKESDAYPADCEDGYGWEKLFTERMCRHFTDEFDLDTRVARYHNVYGPHGALDAVRAKAPAAICRKVAQAVRSGTHEIEIWGDGEQTRSFMFIDDCVEGTVRLMESKHKDPINIGSDRLISINQLVDLMEEIAGVKLKRRYDLSAPQGVRGRNSDNTLLRHKLAWEPQVGLEEGLERTYRWVYDQCS